MSESPFINPASRLFIGIYPCGIVYADRNVMEHGDYRRLAFLDYQTLALDQKPDVPECLIPLISEDVQQMRARKGQFFRISACNQGVILGQQSSSGT